MDFKKMIGLGVAGNFTGHLEQAGEAVDFANVSVEDVNAPKGLFPFYVPANTGQFVEIYPLSSSKIARPLEGGNLQIEPEVAIICEIIYKNDSVVNILPKKFGAYNDCSIRKPGARKISEKKNWGKDSKGLSETLIDIDKFSLGGIMDSYRLACYLHRKGGWHVYGVDSPLLGYSYFYEKLLTWAIKKTNEQQDEGPLENILKLLNIANYPSQAVISIGATRYTDFGEKTFLESGDESYVVVYNSTRFSIKEIEKILRNNDLEHEGLSILKQTVF